MLPRKDIHRRRTHRHYGGENATSPALTKGGRSCHGAISNWSDEEIDEPLTANDRNYYKVEKWTKDGSKVDHMAICRQQLDEAREVFAAAIYNRPRIRLTIRQRTQVLEQWPVSAR
jgi:hypothetical protein